jgi:putative ubiquitin-RnfH superfamily antitoxin RatB of RatAB toxin-antitoxin module
MKKAIIIAALALTLIGCKKSNIEQEIDEYDLRKAKLGYLKDLLDTKEELEAQEKSRIIDSLILEEKTRLHNDSN